MIPAAVCNEKLLGLRAAHPETRAQTQRVRFSRDRQVWPHARVDFRLELAMDEENPPSADTANALGSDALFSEVYDRLKAMAGRRLGRVARGTLDTTALVHELYLRIGNNDALVFAHPNQFFTYAARAMRHLLADRARDRLRQRAGGDWIRTTLTGADHRLVIESAEQALALDGALHELAQTDARAAQVVELICFAGLSHEQAAETLGLALRTVGRDWRFARAFLKTQLE